MLFGFAAGGGGVVGLLFIQGAPLGRDPVQLEAKGAPAGDAAAHQLLLRQIPAEIAVEFPIGPIAGVAIAGTPHRQGGTAVPAKEGHPPGGADRCKHPIAGPRQGMEKAMAIQHRVAQAVGHQDLVKALVVGALGQPNPLGPFTELAFMLGNGRAHLGADGLGDLAQEGQVSVGCGAGDQIEHPKALEAPKAGD